MVFVVLDSPGLVGVNEGHEGNGPHNVLHQLVLAEGLVGTVVANHKQLNPNSIRKFEISQETERRVRRTLTPVAAVPAKAQAKGRRYQGEYAIPAMLAATETTVSTTDFQALNSSNSNTCSLPNGSKKSRPKGTSLNVATVYNW